MNSLLKTISITKQAVAQYEKRQLVLNEKAKMLVLKAEKIRAKHPGCGVKKLYEKLAPDFIGRDKCIDLLMNTGFRLPKKRNYKRTTYAGKEYYPNLIKGYEVKAPSVIWQSDITYIYVGGKFYYATFIIDVFTKGIVGYHVSTNMKATANIIALKKALKHHKAPTIHHSDRGGQYISKDYTDLLTKEETVISMAESAQDNAYAERINRTIKEEYLQHWQPETFDQLKKHVQRAVNHYNTERNHNNIGNQSPSEFEKKWHSKQLNFDPEFKIFDDGRPSRKEEAERYKRIRAKRALRKNKKLSPKKIKSFKAQFFPE